MTYQNGNEASQKNESEANRIIQSDTGDSDVSILFNRDRKLKTPRFHKNDVLFLKLKC